MEKLKDEGKSHEMGMHTEQLAGRTQQIFFSPTEEENFTYPHAYDVDFNKRAEFDAREMDIRGINLKIRSASAFSTGCSSTSKAASAISAAGSLMARTSASRAGSAGPAPKT
jgi:methylamine---glutamate N-methyltransferase subunit B